MTKVTLKGIAMAVSGTATVGTGGYVYYDSLPNDGSELLTREGLRIIDDQDYYVGIGYDHRGKELEDIAELNSTSITDPAQAKTKIGSGCEEELKGKPYSGEIGKERKELYTTLCTTSGITTVKARLGHSGHTGGIDDVGDKDKVEKHGKSKFAVLRQDKDFQKGINNNSTDPISDNSEITKYYVRFKEKCTSILYTPYEELKEQSPYQNAALGCKAMDEETVEQRIIRMDEFRIQGYKPGKKNTKEKIKLAWEHTETAKKTVKPNGGDPSEEEGWNWCNAELAKKFYDEASVDGYYPDKYIKVREICNDNELYTGANKKK